VKYAGRLFHPSSLSRGPAGHTEKLQESSGQTITP
jgi:hypothetical protein